MDNFDALNHKEKSELAALYFSWVDARRNRQYSNADHLREKLSEWGCFSPDYTEWHPVLESPNHRMKRIALRATYLIGQPAP